MTIDVLERLWEGARERLLFHTRDEFMTELSDWVVEGRYSDGELIGAVMKRGAELHFTVFVPGKVTRAMMREIVESQFLEYGYVETRTPIDLESQHRFNKTVGFVEVGRDTYDVHYRMEKSSCRLQRYQ